MKKIKVIYLDFSILKKKPSQLHIAFVERFIGLCNRFIRLLRTIRPLLHVHIIYKII